VLTTRQKAARLLHVRLLIENHACGRRRAVQQRRRREARCQQLHACHGLACALAASVCKRANSPEQLSSDALGAQLLPGGHLMLALCSQTERLGSRQLLRDTTNLAWRPPGSAAPRGAARRPCRHARGARSQTGRWTASSSRWTRSKCAIKLSEDGPRQDERQIAKSPVHHGTVLYGPRCLPTGGLQPLSWGLFRSAGLHIAQAALLVENAVVQVLRCIALLGAARALRSMHWIAL